MKATEVHRADWRNPGRRGDTIRGLLPLRPLSEFVLSLHAYL